jgi:hypothetical protein
MHGASAGDAPLAWPGRTSGRLTLKKQGSQFSDAGRLGVSKALTPEELLFVRNMKLSEAIYVVIIRENYFFCLISS